MLKLRLFSILFGFVVRNRYWFTRVLRAGQADATQLTIDLLLETECSLWRRRL
jgi:hypothetical protein